MYSIARPSCVDILQTVSSEVLAKIDASPRNMCFAGMDVSFDNFNIAKKRNALSTDAFPCSDRALR